MGVGAVLLVGKAETIEDVCSAEVNGLRRHSLIGFSFESLSIDLIGLSHQLICLAVKIQSNVQSLQEPEELSRDGSPSS